MKNIVILLSIVCMAFTSCGVKDTGKGDDGDVSASLLVDIEDMVGKWERYGPENHYVLDVNANGTGELVIYEMTVAAKEKFTMERTEKGIIIKWGNGNREKYHAVLTTDGQYLVVDNGTNYYVYRKRK